MSYPANTPYLPRFLFYTLPLFLRIISESTPFKNGEITQMKQSY